MRSPARAINHARSLFYAAKFGERSPRSVRRTNNTFATRNPLRFGHDRPMVAQVTRNQLDARCRAIVTVISTADDDETVRDETCTTTRVSSDSNAIVRVDTDTKRS